MQIKGGEKILFGYDDVRDQKDIIIVEGEMDKLALNVAGFWNVVSVPDGAPSKASSERSLPPVEKDRKYSYLWNCRFVCSEDRASWSFTLCTTKYSTHVLQGYCKVWLGFVLGMSSMMQKRSLSQWTMMILEMRYKQNYQGGSEFTDAGLSIGHFPMRILSW